MLTLLAMIAALQAQSPDERALAAAAAASQAVAAAVQADLCEGGGVAEAAMRSQQVFVTDSRAEAGAAVRALEMLAARTDGALSDQIGELVERFSRVGGRLEQAEALNLEARAALYEMAPPCVFMR